MHRAGSTPTQNARPARQHLEFEFHTVKSEPKALLLEGRLIKEYRPSTMSALGRQTLSARQVNLNDPIRVFN